MSVKREETEDFRRYILLIITNLADLDSMIETCIALVEQFISTEILRKVKDKAKRVLERLKRRLISI